MGHEQVLGVDCDVPAQGLDVPALSLDVPALSLDVPALSLDVPALSLDVPALTLGCDGVAAVCRTACSAGGCVGLVWVLVAVSRTAMPCGKLFGSSIRSMHVARLRYSFDAMREK